MYCCDLCGKEGSIEGSKEFEQASLGEPRVIKVRLGENSNKEGVNNIRTFKLCEKCAKEFNVPNGGTFVISKKHELTFEELMK